MSRIATLLTAAAIAVTPVLPAYEPEGCNHLHGSKVAYTGLRKALRHTHEVEPLRVRNLWRCTTSRAKAHATHRFATKLRGWRRKPPQLHWIRYHRLPDFWRTWAERVVQCETGNNPYAGDNVHIGRFEWLPATWAAAGGRGSPATTSYPQEALVAVSWARRAGVSQWQCS